MAHRDVHISIPEPEDVLASMLKGTLQVSNYGSRDREIFLDYLVGSKVITRVPRRGKEGGQRV